MGNHCELTPLGGAFSNEPERLALKYDPNSVMMQSYKTTKGAEGQLFEKTLYNWHSIPITTPLSFQQSAYFRVKSRGIFNDNFVVGVIKRTAVKEQVRLPWKTTNCICFESHKEKESSGIIYNEKVQKARHGLAENTLLEVSITPELISFHINNLVVAKMDFPKDFTKEVILPYVALFNEGDAVELVGAMEQETLEERLL